MFTRTLSTCTRTFRVITSSGEQCAVGCVIRKVVTVASDCVFRELRVESDVQLCLFHFNIEMTLRIVKKSGKFWKFFNLANKLN